MSAAKKYAYIDALRGYAVLLVITCHCGGMFSELPYPLKKLTNFGWHGVQLFFLMSCVTLLMSWNSSKNNGSVSFTAFWLRRLFRIAPMYFLAALVYYLIEPPKSGFDLGQLLASLLFVNAWYPTLIPTVPDLWMVVPGGWSVGVEFSFYLVFPLIATLVCSLRRAIGFTAISVILGSIANSLVTGPLLSLYGETATDNFTYFWFPNQLPVFALGTVLYFCINRIAQSPGGLLTRLIHRYGTLMVLMCAAALACVANMHFPHSLPLSGPLIIPTLFVASLLFMIIVVVLATNPSSVFINAAMCSLGKFSFSAYLVHFAVLHKLPLIFPGLFNIKAVGVQAIGVFFCLWVVALMFTYGISMMTYTFIEHPMIHVGRRFLEMRMFRKAVVVSV